MQELSWKTICGYFPKRNRNSHKGTFGTLLCMTGSNRMPGACALSTLAALRSGAGLVKVATTERNLPILALPRAYTTRIQLPAKYPVFPRL